jgi:F0F1-type ATP synthase assembly protein I
MMLAFIVLVHLLQLGDLVSAISGCLASLLPSVYFSFRILRQAHNNGAATWLGHAYRANIGKWILAGIIFALLFSSSYQWDPLILFVGYLLVQLSGMFVPLIQKGN